MVVITLVALSYTTSASTLKETRANFKSKIFPSTIEGGDIEIPPKGILSIVDYPSSVGLLKAYLTPDPKDQQRHPAIIWIVGGDCNSIGEVWTKRNENNDQTASAYRESGVIMMYPSLRGGNANPGRQEGFLGEVDDIISAYNYLKTLPYVDSTQVYLGGHSTGGTLVLLTAELSTCFAGIISFGPVSGAISYGYGSDFLPFDASDDRESEVRAPAFWLEDIKTPTIVIEGGSGNTWHLEIMRRFSKNPKVKFLKIPNGNHFSILFPTNKLLAKSILKNNLFGSADSIANAVNEQLKIKSSAIPR